MMYTQFLCAALLLSNSFFSLQAIIIASTQRSSSPERKSSMPSCSMLSREEGSRSISTPSIVDSRIYPSHSLYDSETPGAYWNRIERQDKEKLDRRQLEINSNCSCIIQNQLPMLPHDPALSQEEIAKLFMLHRKKNFQMVQPDLIDPKNICLLQPQDLILKEKFKQYSETISIPHEAPNMHYMSAASVEAYVVFGSIAGISSFAPVLAPFAAGGALGYIVYKIIQDNSKKKATKKALEETEKKAQEEKNQNGGGGPKKPDDEEIKKKIEQAHIDPKDLLHNNKTENYEIVIPDKKSIEKHIFRNEPGHLLDTPENRKLIVDVASDDKNFLVTDDFKLNWFAKTLENGKQVWVRTKSDGSIVNAGINDVPKIADPNRGLCNNIMKSE